MSDVLKGVCLACLFLLLMVAYAEKAYPHEWYDPECCSETDCKPIASCSELSEQQDGSVSWGKYTFKKKDVRPSRDSKCHVCLFRGATPMCVYVQQGS